MCSICGSPSCRRNTRTKLVSVYGEYKQYSTFREYLGYVVVNDWDDDRTIRRKVLAEYPNAEVYD